jgi:hypothetical protein
MERTYTKDVKIRDLDLEVTFKVKGDVKERPPLHDEELKGLIVDIRA